MILIDAGPLIALLSRTDPDHRMCRAALAQLAGPLLTTWPVVTEAMHFLGKHGGWLAQAALWRMVRDGKVRFVDDQAMDPARVSALMEKYADVPMDLADASLVAAAEQIGIDHVFTLDGDFAAYRLNGRRAFTIIPTLGR